MIRPETGAAALRRHLTLQYSQIHSEGRCLCLRHRMDATSGSSEIPSMPCHARLACSLMTSCGHDRLSKGVLAKRWRSCARGQDLHRCREQGDCSCCSKTYVPCSEHRTGGAVIQHRPLLGPRQLLAAFLLTLRVLLLRINAVALGRACSTGYTLAELSDFDMGHRRTPTNTFDRTSIDHRPRLRESPFIPCIIRVLCNAEVSTSDLRWIGKCCANLAA